MRVSTDRQEASRRLARENNCRGFAGAYGWLRATATLGAHHVRQARTLVCLKPIARSGATTLSVRVSTANTTRLQEA